MGEIDQVQSRLRSPIPLPWLFCMLPVDPRPSQWLDPHHWGPESFRLHLCADTEKGFRRPDDVGAEAGVPVPAPATDVKMLLPIIDKTIPVVVALARLHKQEQLQAAEEAAASKEKTNKRAIAETPKEPTKREQALAAGLRACVPRLEAEAKALVSELLDTPYECFSFLHIMSSSLHNQQRIHDEKVTQKEEQRRLAKEAKKGKPGGQSNFGNSSKLQVKQKKHKAHGTPKHREYSIADSMKHFHEILTFGEAPESLLHGQGLQSVTRPHGVMVWVRPQDLDTEEHIYRPQWGKKVWDLTD